MEELKLEAPGKGLPFIESLVMKFYVGPVLSKKNSVEENWKRFENFNKKILKAVDHLNLEDLHKKILVPRLQGIEDSSRNWSIAETLEHIELVGDNIAGLLSMLAEKRVPDVVVDIASYKPKGKYQGKDPKLPFREFNQRTLERFKNMELDLKSPKFKHPWLGMLSPLQWQWLLASHSGIHYAQIKEILKRLPELSAQL